MTRRSRLVGDGTYTFAVRVLNAVAAAGLGVLTARVLGPHGRGVYAIPMVDAALVGAGFAGLNSATSYFLLQRKAGRRILRPALAAAALFVAIASAFAVAVAWGGHALWAGVPASLALPGAAALSLGSGFAIGTRRVRLTSTLAIASTLAGLAAIVIAFVGIGAGPGSAILGWVAGADILGAGIVAWMVRDARKLDPGAPVVPGEFLSYAARSGAVGIVSLLNYRADVYIVAVLSTPVMLGMYTLAVSGAESLLLATQVTAIVGSVDISTLEQRASAQFTARCVRHNVLVAGPCSLALAFVAPYVVNVLYGSAFMPMVGALRVLLLGVFVLSLGSPMSTFFTLKLGKPEVSLMLAAVSSVVCIAASWLLVPNFGIVGAAWGSTFGYALAMCGAIAYFARFAGLSASELLVPRRSDLLAYAQILRSLLRYRSLGPAG
jgi:O-antigen/teichoic acid export membrane protein